MKKCKILAIAPYEGLKHLFETVAKERDNIMVDIFIGNLSEGARLVQKYQDNGYDVIISRGGTAQAIEEVSKLPVIDVSFSSLDMIRAIRLSKNFTGKKAILGFPKITEAAKVICSLIQFDIDIFTIYNEEESFNLIEQLAHENYELIIGDTYAAYKTRKLDFKNILITTGKESVESVFNQVSQILTYNHKQQEQLTIYKTVLDKAGLSFFMFDEDGQVLLQSSHNLSIPKKVLLDEMRKHIPKVVKSKTDIFFDKLHQNSLYEIRATKVAINEANYIVFFPKVKINITNNTKNWLSIIDKKNKVVLDYSIDIFDSNNPLVKKMISVAKNISNNTQPLVLLGEEGIGKSTLATYIYHHNSTDIKPLLSFDCSLINNNNWNFLFNNHDSPLYLSNHYLYFNNINYISNDIAIDFVNYLKKYKDIFYNRLIVSYTDNHNNDFSSNLIINYLLTSLNAILLRVPSLNQRKEDIPSLTNLLINQYNIKYGKQIVGLEEDAKDILYNFEWKKNLKQLTATIRQLVITSNNSFITKADVAYVLDKEHPKSNRYDGQNINLNQPLEDIEKDIIKVVLKEEDFNQTKAANRLNISRATIWRKLKDVDF